MLLSNRRRHSVEVLPYDSEIEYLESRANTYINTGINAANDIGIEIHYYDNYTYGNCSNYIVGARQTSSSTILYSISGSTSNNSVLVTYNGSTKLMGHTRTKGEDYKAQLQATSSGMVYSMTINNGTPITGTLSGTDLGTTNVPICMFGFNASNIKSYTRLYYLKIRKGGDLVRDFIPVRVGNVGALYDKVSKQIFYNSGSGTFVLGQDK